MNNPQALVNPEAMASLRAGFEQAGPQGAVQADQLLELLRVSLAQAIGDVFSVTVVILAVAFLLTIFLTSPRAKKDEKSSSVQPEPAPADGD